MGAPVVCSSGTKASAAAEQPWVDGCIATEVEHECTTDCHKRGCPCEVVLVVATPQGETSRHPWCVGDDETVVGHIYPRADRPREAGRSWTCERCGEPLV